MESKRQFFAAHPATQTRSCPRHVIHEVADSPGEQRTPLPGCLRVPGVLGCQDVQGFMGLELKAQGSGPWGCRHGLGGLGFGVYLWPSQLRFRA